MRNQHSIMQEYEASLPTRARDYQAAQADSERLRMWFGAVIHWVGKWLVIWGEALQPEQSRPQWQNPPQA